MSAPLHEEGDFKLTRYSWEGSNWNSWIWHKCGHLGTWHECACNEPKGAAGMCWECKAPIPEGIYGLWRLHNWEWIQKRGG